ncbi:hypothetical protein P154DRAFT_263623 [Amniculicola lignicola CBS 123094]|uniref:Methyltransferase domain-containing protein n=1 Tax=Amniculicola lignicola CBS 123094 TaxID=1392246 RepID=A0A6A5WDE8_9PLEO|nr:hypothetical protein P154DRAFT_263623 [Amniculicola lignicola CBS 123094]
MGPDSPLPLPPDFADADEYVDSVLKFATSSWLLQTLCGGVHILDFCTREPDLYSAILPESWRTWFKDQDIMDILDVLMREDLQQFDSDEKQQWRGGAVPPKDLLQYIKDVRRHLLARDFPSPGSPAPPQKSSIARHIAMGMKVKKVHEVDHFARYIDRLTAEIAAERKEITHLVDFGSGQNYLGRALAAPPYSKHIVAVESKQHNIEGAKNMDILAKLVAKPVTMVNKKEYRKAQDKRKKGLRYDANGVIPTALDESPAIGNGEPEIEEKGRMVNSTLNGNPVSVTGARDECNVDGCEGCEQTPPSISSTTKSCTNGSTDQPKAVTTTLQIYNQGHGSVQYVEHIIQGGDLGPVVDQILDASQARPATTPNPSQPVQATNINTVPKSTEPNLMVISLHSCGNLVHHGLRSLLLNPAVSAVAMVGCCYNLMTERLGPPTFKLPSLRPNHPRLETTANAFDPNGFPMSEHMANYPLPLTPQNEEQAGMDPPRGIRLNITARMMAVQAPQNWGRSDSELFFTRHFYRALLQRIFLDHGVVAAPTTADDMVGDDPTSPSPSPSPLAASESPRINYSSRGPGLSSDGTLAPLTIGTLRKFAYADFVSYVRAAISKLLLPNTFCAIPASFISSKLSSLTDEQIRGYEEEYAGRKKELSVMWALMAFSAGVVESLVVVDRWLWLREQEGVGECWVEAVFGYEYSPRNLVVVGVRK